MNTFIHALILSLITTGLSAETLSGSHDVSNLYITGLAISAPLKRVAISGRARDTPQDSFLALADISTPSDLVQLDTPAGLDLHDPSFSPDGDRIVFAGFCPVERHECQTISAGWNIFSYDLEARSTTQLTLPDLRLVRWKPLITSEDKVYYVGLPSQTNGGLSVGSLISPSAIFEARGGQTDPIIFPSQPFHPLVGFITNPFTRLQTVDLLSVEDGAIYIKARLSVASFTNLAPKLNRIENPLPHDPINEDGHWDLDPRMRDMAYQFVYAGELPAYRDRNTLNTVFIIRDNEVSWIGGEFDLSGEGFEANQMTRADMENGVIYFESNNFLDDLPNRIWRVQSGEVVPYFDLPRDQNFLFHMDMSESVDEGSMYVVGNYKTQINIWNSGQVVSEIDLVTFGNGEQ